MKHSAYLYLKTSAAEYVSKKLKSISCVRDASPIRDMTIGGIGYNVKVAFIGTDRQFDDLLAKVDSIRNSKGMLVTNTYSNLHDGVTYSALLKRRQGPDEDVVELLERELL